MGTEVMVIGAGVAGLQCARQLQQAGIDVVVLDRARGVGGRVATRRFDDQPVDYGVLFFHGHQPDFLAALDQIEGATPLRGWPRRVNDSGTPCQVEAFASYERRVAFAEGVSVFPKHLARGLDVRLETPVSRVELTDDGWAAVLDGGERVAARQLVLALALEQVVRLLEPLPASRVLDSVRALLGMMASLPCLTLIAGYGLDAPAPDWDVSFPSDSSALQLMAVDSSKRPGAKALVLVYQALPRWSAAHLDEPAERWQTALLDEAGARLGGWAQEPRFTHPHRWRYSRVDRGNELAQPVLATLDGGQRLGLIGDVFAPGGGVQAAWLSGDRLARRWIEEVGR